MTIKELIEQLQTLNPELRMFTEGYEGGYDDINHIEERNVSLNVHKQWYYGKHDIFRDGDENRYETVKGIILTNIIN